MDEYEPSMPAAMAFELINRLDCARHYDIVHDLFEPKSRITITPKPALPNEPSRQYASINMYYGDDEPEIAIRSVLKVLNLLIKRHEDSSYVVSNKTIS